MNKYFPKPKNLGKWVKAELDLSNYAAKADLKNATVVQTSAFAKKIELANLKSDVAKLNIDILRNVPRLNTMLRSQILKRKYLILLT